MMSDKKWTPGEWLADDVAVRTGDKALVSLVYGNGEGSFNANAHLIAAAPDLYEALYRIVTRYHKGEDIYGWIDVAGQTLAKARGEQ